MFYVPTTTPLRERFAHTARRLALAAAVRVLTRLEAVASEQTTPAAPTLVEAAPVAVEATPAVPLFTTADMPPAETIAAAAADFDQAADDARAAERAKRRARKLLDRLPTGAYGEWMISREPSARQTPDLDRIRADYARAGLGDVPMKATAPTLKVTLTPAVEADTVEAVAVAA